MTLATTDASQPAPPQVGAAVSKAASNVAAMRSSLAEAPPRPSAAPSGDTPLAALGLRPVLVDHLRTLGVVVLEDLTFVTEDELREGPRVGTVTVASVKALLDAAGLSLAPDPAELIEPEPAAPEPPVTASTAVSRLGLSRELTRSLVEAGFTTVGTLVAQPAMTLKRQLGRKFAREVYDALLARGVAPRFNRSELYLGGLRTLAEIEPPRPDTPVQECVPWLGLHIARACRHAQLLTFGAVCAVVQARGLARLPGIGPVGEAKVRAVLLRCRLIPSEDRAR